ncbi:hypothetical protein Nepgr_011437 [Nepenthes gracilis]|uniref:Uncharacterized protein n=1 Tax=Nepenthes gracilis TaxID=150966 RepID=A0AAD3SFG4_NEPGR|nr:hypothetical protein Nepgr_011437 [Nepenthes gracilis]
MLLMYWSTGPQVGVRHLIFNNWWSRCRLTIACSNCSAHRGSNNCRWLHQPSSPLPPPKKVARGRRSRPKGLRKPGMIRLQRPPALLARTGQRSAPGVRLLQKAQKGEILDILGQMTITQSRSEPPDRRFTTGGAIDQSRTRSDKTELRNFLNSKRSPNATRGRPTSGSNLNRVFPHLAKAPSTWTVAFHRRKS